MHQTGSYIKYSDNRSSNFVDEIIIGESPTINKIFHNNFETALNIQPEKNKSKSEKNFQNYILNFSIISFTLIALIIVFSKIVSTTFLSFNSFSASIFVGGYFALFLFTICIISRRKMLTLRIKNDTLLLKCFPTFSEKIPISQILKCELNTINNGEYNSKNKTQFALNENGNRFKQPLASGIILQLINGQRFFIASHKS